MPTVAPKAEGVRAAGIGTTTDKWLPYALELAEGVLSGGRA